MSWQLARYLLVVTAAADVAACSNATVSDPPSPVDRSRYQGRPIADLCTSESWLERPERAAEEQPERVLDQLALRPGMTVADVGAGTGYYTARLSARLGPTGEVIASELQPEMLRNLAARLGREQLTNVRLVRADDHRANLPERCCDVVLMVDVYHELRDPPAVMAGVRRALKPRGRLVVVEYKAEDRTSNIRPEHRTTLDQLRDELTAMGFALVSSYEQLPRQRVVTFTRDDAI